MAHKDLMAHSNISTSRHWKWFKMFCDYDMQSGGPDAHMTLAGYMSQGLSKIERLWHAGVYVCVYNVPSAEVLWTAFPYDAIMDMSHEEVTSWLIDNWKGITTRRERKCVRIPKNMATFLKDYANWITGLSTSPLLLDDVTDEERYEMFWINSQKSVKFLGRYSCFKLLEFIERFCDVPIKLPDIRPIGGWSPRSMLSILYPEYANELLGNDAPDNLKIVNSVAEAGLDTLHEAGLPDLRMFQYEVFLCDYKQCYFTKRQYPGRSQDSEIAYLRKIESFWDMDFQMLDARSIIFPHWALGELNGWEHVREELGKVLFNYGYMWSDKLYDYKNTIDLSVPTSKVCLI